MGALFGAAVALCLLAHILAVMGQDEGAGPYTQALGPPAPVDWRALWARLRALGWLLALLLAAIAPPWGLAPLMALWLAKVARYLMGLARP